MANFDKEKDYRIRAKSGNDYYDLGCASLYSIYAYKDTPDWSNKQDANKFHIVKQNDGAWDIILGTEWSMYISGEHCNGWYCKTEGSKPGTNQGKFKLVADTMNPGHYFIECGQYWLWLSDHAGLGGAWYVKGVSSGVRTPFKITPWKANGEL